MLFMSHPSLPTGKLRPIDVDKYRKPESNPGYDLEVYGSYDYVTRGRNLDKVTRSSVKQDCG